MAFQIITFSCYGSTVCKSAFDQRRWNQGSTYSLVAAVLYMIVSVYELLLPNCEAPIRKQEEHIEEEKSENLTAIMKARAYLAKRDADQALDAEADGVTVEGDGDKEEQ